MSNIPKEFTSTSGPSQVSIENNMLLATDLDFLTNYYGSSSNATNAAIFAIHPLTTQSNIVTINSNYIGGGASTNDNITTVNYNYFQGITTDAYAIVTNNTVSGVSGSTTSGASVISNAGTTAMIYCDGISSSMITDNVMQRGSSSIDAYVYNNSSSKQVVIDNSFDNSTVDDISSILDAGTLAGSSYSRNINQTAYLSVALTDYATYIADGGANSDGFLTNQYPTGPAALQDAFFYDNTIPSLEPTAFPPFTPVPNTSIFTAKRVRGISGNYIEGSEYTWLQFIMNGYSPTSFGVNFSTSIPLDYILPQNVQIINAAMSIWLNEQGALANLHQASQQSNQISLSIVQYNKTLNLSNGNSVLDTSTNVGFISGIPYDKTVLPNPNVNNFTIIVYDAAAPASGVGYEIVSESQIMGSSILCSVVPSSTLISGLNNKMTLEVNMGFIPQVPSTIGLAAGQVNWILSPIVVTYRW